MRRIAVFFSDTHGGHKLGLMNPAVTLYEEDENGDAAPWTPEPTAMQRYLWRLYEKAIGEVARFAGNDPVHVFHAGDLTQGKAYTDHLVSTRTADQLFIAVANMVPWFKAELNLKTFRLAQGTGSHIFGEGSATLLVAQSLRDKFPGHSVKETRHGLVTLAGIKIDYAHHGPSSGIREWTEGNQLRYYLKSIVIGDVLRGKTPPRLVVRGHFHEYTPERVTVAKRYKADIVLLPSFCGMGEYGRQATRSKPYISNGLVMVEIVDGKMREPIPLVKELDLRMEEVLGDTGR